MRIELQILKNLTRNEEYHRKVIPFIKNEYFTEPSDEIVFDLIKNYFSRYNSLPVIDQLRTEFDDMDGVGEMTARAVMDVFDDISRGDADNQSWITDQTEGFCKDRALFNAIKTSLSIMNGDTKQDRGGIPKILQDALAVTFDPSVGHDYLEEYEDQLEYYNRVEEKLPFDIELINKITNNGLSKKTLTIILGGVHAGKTLTMCHFSAAHLNLGKKVLYISLEMSEHEIVRRIDSNLLDIPINELEKIPKNMYESKMNKLRSRCRGKLIVKEYPTGGANVNHFRALLNELKLKKNFVPDVVYVDYLNICSSSRYKAGASGMYEYVKSISEELRGLAVENDFRVITATQLNRTGFRSSDPDMADVAESFGTTATADLILSIVSTDELKELDQRIIKQLKNRMGDINNHTSFVVGIDTKKMRLYDVGESGQSMLDTPVMDNSRVYTDERKKRLGGIKFE